MNILILFLAKKRDVRASPMKKEGEGVVEEGGEGEEGTNKVAPKTKVGAKLPKRRDTENGKTNPKEHVRMPSSSFGERDKKGKAAEAGKGEGGVKGGAEGGKGDGQVTPRSAGERDGKSRRSSGSYDAKAAESGKSGRLQGTTENTIPKEKKLTRPLSALFTKSAVKIGTSHFRLFRFNFNQTFFQAAPLPKKEVLNNAKKNVKK